MEHLLKIKCVNVHIKAATNVTFTLTTVQVLNLALTHTKRITVWSISSSPTYIPAMSVRYPPVLLSRL